MPWQLQEAKQQFSAVVRKALNEGPQIVTRHGEAVVVVLAIDEYEQLRHPRENFAHFLLEGPDFEQLDLTRDQQPARIVEL